MFSGVMVLDGYRARFAIPDWKTMLVVKVLRSRLRELLSRSFKAPGKPPTQRHQKWLDVWQRIFTQDFGSSGNGYGGTGGDGTVAGVAGSGSNSAAASAANISTVNPTT